MPAIALSAALGLAQRASAQAEYADPVLPPQNPALQGQTDPEGVETLTQGPIHEAFANPSELDPTAPPVVDQAPPEPIPEEPPAYKPEGDYTWIPGYWMWDDERADFIWVTGVWRQPPPGMQWVPGYWTEANGGFQRITGYWTSVEVSELSYQEPPPESLDVGPTSPAPDDNYFWIPGTWNYYDTGFRWRAGYWAPYQPNWVWYPARWVWTPAGCIYNPGFWDYRVAVRGQCFAPAFFHRTVFLQPRFVYRPWCVIPPDNLFIHLWIRPRWCHYYFGNFYGSHFADLGFHPWCYFPTRRHFYDPLFTYARVHYHRHGIDFVGRTRGWHDHFARHEDLRPRRTWRDQREWIARARRDDRFAEQISQSIVARDIVQVARSESSAVPLTRLDDRARDRLVNRARDLRQLNEVRRRTESQAARITDRGARVADNRELQNVTRDLREALRETRPDARDVSRDVTRGARDDAREAREAARDRLDDARDRLEDRGRADVADRIRDRVDDRAEVGERADVAERARDRVDDRVGRLDDEAAERLQDRGDAIERARDRLDETRDLSDRARDRLEGRAEAARESAEGRAPPGQEEVPATPPGADRIDRGPARDVEDRLPRIDPDRGPRRTDRPETPGLDRTPGRPDLDRTPGRPDLDRTPGIDRTPGPDLDRSPQLPDLGGGEDRPLRGPDRGPSLDRDAVPRIDRDALRGPSVERPSVGPRLGSPREPPAARPRIESFERRELPDAAGPGGGLGERPAVTPQLETPRGANPRPAPRMNLPRTDVPSPRIEAPGASPRIAPPRAGASGPQIDRGPSVRPNVSSPRPSISRGSSGGPSISRGRSGGGGGPPASRGGGGGGRGRGRDRDD